jgi:hypothetical protein
VREVELDAVEPRRAGAVGRVREEAREDPGKVADVRQVDVRDPLPRAEVERLAFALGKHAPRGVRRKREQRRADRGVVRRRERRVAGELGQPLPVLVAELEEAAEELRGLGAPPDREEVDALDEEPRLASRTVATSSRRPGT